MKHCYPQRSHGRETRANKMKNTKGRKEKTGSGYGDVVRASMVARTEESDTETTSPPSPVARKIHSLHLEADYVAMKAYTVLITPFVLCLILSTSAAAERCNLLRHGSFDAPEATLNRVTEPGHWIPVIHGNSDAELSLVELGRGGSTCVQYQRVEPGNDNVHLDQVVELEPGKIYEARAWVRGDGTLNPVISVTTIDWRPLATTASHASDDWTDVRLPFRAPRGGKVRFEWFPGSHGDLYEGRPGTSWLDDVSIRKISDPPSALLRSFELRRSKAGAEIDRSKVNHLAVGNAQPIRPVRCRDGRLVYEDGSEVALWGVNFQTALSWEYHTRFKQIGVPLDAEVLKDISDRNLQEIQAMGAEVIRLHLCPADFTDADGELRESIYLDVLDHLLAKCHQSGTYMYLTLVNDMNTRTFDDTFMRTCERREWLFKREFIDKTKNYVASLLEHRNRYSGRTFAEDPALAVIEIINEPDYLTWGELQSDPPLTAYRNEFDNWHDRTQQHPHREASFHLWRYQRVKQYIDEMVEVVRKTGAEQPIGWNLNWPRKIRGHEDVFQAAADSQADAVSVCLYPGQQDVKSPFWKHAVNLDDKNYLPFLEQNYNEYERLRWILGQRFAAKAKLVYEFETFYTQNSYLYPAMARLMRSLGVQIAPMWTYTLTPYAKYHSGSHYLNYYCTPEKAVSFAIAAEVFRNTPLYAPFELQNKRAMEFGACRVSAERNRSVWQTSTKLMHSRSIEDLPHPDVPNLRKVLACCSSPVVSYEGTGIYQMDIAKERIELRIAPDAQFIQPHWERPESGERKLVCRLDDAAEHRFELSLPGWGGPVVIYRVEEEGKVRVMNDGPGVDFMARPGTYHIEKLNE